MKYITVICSILFLSGCAFSPQKANLNPTPSVGSSEVGAGVTVAVKVTDERATKSLGRRGTAYGAAAEITSAQDVAVVVQGSIVDALRKKGFASSDYNASSPTRLVIEIRFLDYSTSQGFWTGGVQVQAALKATAHNAGKTFDKMYRSEKEERVVVVPTAATNEAWINERLTDVLNQLVNDTELLNFLANK